MLSQAVVVFVFEIGDEETSLSEDDLASRLDEFSQETFSRDWDVSPDLTRSSNEDSFIGSVVVTSSLELDTSSIFSVVWLSFLEDASLVRGAAKVAEEGEE